MDIYSHGQIDNENLLHSLRLFQYFINFLAYK